MPYYLGLDLGGTNIKAGLTDEAGALKATLSVPTGAEGGPDAVMKNLVHAAQQVAGKAGMKLAEVAGIGIGSPGPLNLEEGIVLWAPNMPGWRNVPIRARIAEGTGRPTVLENDANAAAFGEFWAGAGRDPSIRHFVMLTLGTGVGAGIVVDNVLMHGAYGKAAEAGHMIVEPEGRQCGCGQRGCLEAYASASRTALRARERLEAGHNSSLRPLFEQDPDKVDAKAVFDAAMAGDDLAQQVVDQTAFYLGIACISLCRVLDPQMVVFAGGMALAGDYLIDRIRHAFRRQTWVIDEQVILAVAKLGNDAGVIGAAGVAWDAHQRGKLV